MIQNLRIACLLGIHFIILAHIYIFGDKIIGSVDFQEFFHSFLKHGIINSGVLLVILAFVTTLIFGRFFCGWACHFGAVQEFAWWVFNKLGIKPKTINSSLITVLPIFMLLNFYIVPNILYAIESPWKGVSVNLGMPEIWAFLPGFIIGLLTFIVDGFLIVYLLGRKGFCRFLCPWGAFLKLPTALAMFKVRNVGGCTECGVCTSNCPIGIDVSYEINNYKKVANTNCTSCMVCTEGCPSNAIAYKWESPIKENFNLTHYKFNPNMFQLSSIKERFQSVHSKDFLLIILVMIFGFSIDGLYGMGHFLSFGIAIIAAMQFTNSKFITNTNINYILRFVLVFVFSWHGLIKFSIWQGVQQFEKQNYIVAISHMERVVKIYPKAIGRFHIFLGKMYLESGELSKAEYHAQKAQVINPDHTAPRELLVRIDKSVLE